MNVETPYQTRAGGVAGQSVDALDRWITRNGWAGWDPHDIRGTKVFTFLLQPIRSLPLKVARRLALTPLTTFEAAFPVFARRLFGISPAINAKGMALFARGYLQLYAASGEERYRSKAVECLDWLQANRAPGYDEPCWGYPFDWQSGVLTPANTPASVVTSAVADAFWTAHKILNEEKYLRICEGICRSFLTYLNRDDMPDGTICFSYTPLDDFHVHNANLMVAELLVRIGQAAGHDDWQEVGLRAGAYALKEQNADGSIYYWGAVQNHVNPNRVDHYHSGFEIRSLYSIATLSGRMDFRRAAGRYYAFYLKNLIERRGDIAIPKMYPRSLYPVNIHSCAEAILLNATLAPEFPEAARLVEPLVRWVTSAMQSPDGSFAYSIDRVLGRDVKSTIPYVRWGQAWMLLALSQCLLLDASRLENRE